MAVVKAYKIRACGKRGYTLTLPAEWIARNGLVPGDTLDLHVDGSKIIIVAKPRECRGN
jgi:bifunctional DNA-binding transcriptional regulator/antitoxin component of YhaV-PrlF toxin-antitoxin module